MIHVPFICFCKIGITGKSAGKRANQIDRAVFGFPFPVMFVFLPAARKFEVRLHRFFKPLSVRFYRGDGSTEWFWLPAGLPVFLGGCLYWWGLYNIFKHLLPAVAGLI